MNRDKPYNSIGQIIAAGGTLKLGSVMRSGVSIGDARKWIETNYGTSDRKIQDQAILTAERGLAYATEINKTLRSLGGDMSLPEFQKFLNTELIRSKTYGLLSGIGKSPISSLDLFLHSQSKVFDDMPVLPELFGDNPESWRAGITLEGSMEDALNRFRMNMTLRGDETWQEILDRASNWANDMAKYYPDRFSGMTEIEEMIMSIEAVTGGKRF